MNLNEKINRVGQLMLYETNYDKQIEEATEAKARCTKEKEELLLSIKADMEEQKEESHESGDLVATYFSKKEFTWLDDKALLEKLKATPELLKYISTKTTQSVNKNELKKAMKNNSSLQESLSQYVGDRASTYVVVTTKEKTEKMLEHIEANKKGE